MTNSIFSRYSQGENRVTATVLAVLEQLSMEAVEFLLSTAVEGGDQTLELVRYRNQPGGAGKGVPDAQIRGSFHLLFETKVVSGDVKQKQLRRHLEAFEEDDALTKRLYVLSPDTTTPKAVESLNDDRVRWMSFAGLNQSIDEYIGSAEWVLGDRDLFLLRQLQQFFGDENLLTSPDDVVVVPAGSAWDEYRELSAYICQPGRSFRNVAYMGFYRSKQVEPSVARILHVRDQVELSQMSIDSLRDGQERYDQEVANLLDDLMAADGPRKPGSKFKIFLLTNPDDDDTANLGTPIPRVHSGAWTQSHRYTSLDKLKLATSTDDL